MPPRSRCAALGRWQLFSIALSSIWSTHFFGWHDPSSVGHEGSHILGLGIVVGTYWCMNTCSNAIFQVIQFSGGAYGLARVSLGFYTGFLVATTEWLEYTMQMTHAMLLFSNLVTQIVVMTSTMSTFTLQLMLWLTLTCLAVGVHTAPPAVGIRIFLVGGLAVVPVMGALLLFVVTTSRSSALMAAPLTPPRFIDVVRLLPHMCWHFIGVDSLHLCCDDVDDSQCVVPQIKSGTLAVVSVSAIAGLAFAIAYSPIPPSTPPGMDAMLTIFPAALLVLSWLLSASRVLLGMAASRLVCRCLRNRMLLHRAPVLALLVCGVASITFATFASFVPSFRPLDLAIACALFRQMAQCLGFLYLHRMFKHLSDSLRSLWNVARAVAAFVVWLGSFVSLLCLAPNGKTTALVIGVLVSLATVYYFFHVKDAQKYSDAERKSLMFAHVILFNYNKTKQMQRRCRRESLAARRQSMTTPSVPSMPPPSSAKSMQKYTFPPEPARRVVVLSRRNTTVESNFIIRDGKVIPIPATATSPAKTAANNERRKSSAHSIELATLE